MRLPTAKLLPRCGLRRISGFWYVPFEFHLLRRCHWASGWALVGKTCPGRARHYAHVCHVTNHDKCSSCFSLFSFHSWFVWLNNLPFYLLACSPVLIVAPVIIAELENVHGPVRIASESSHIEHLGLSAPPGFFHYSMYHLLSHGQRHPANCEVVFRATMAAGLCNTSRRSRRWHGCVQTPWR